MNNKILILSVLIALCGVLCCGCINAVELDNGTSTEPLSADNNVSTEPLSVDNGATSTLKDTQYKTVTYKEKVFSHYKKYTKTFKCVLDDKSVKKVKKDFNRRMTYGDDECCRYSVGKVVRAWYNDYKAYTWKIMKIKQISKKKYSPQHRGKIAKYQLVVKLFYKKPVYKTVTRTKQVSIYPLT